MKNDDEQLDQLLNSLPVPPMSSHLNPRILAAAKVDDSVSAGLFSQLLRNLMIPKPNYALACSMLLGILLGWQVTSALSVESIPVDEEISSLFLAEVSFYE